MRVKVKSMYDVAAENQMADLSIYTKYCAESLTEEAGISAAETGADREYGFDPLDYESEFISKELKKAEKKIEESTQVKGVELIGVFRGEKGTGALLVDENNYYRLMDDKVEKVAIEEAFNSYITANEFYTPETDGADHRIVELEHGYEMDLASRVTDAIKGYDPYEFADRVDDESIFCATLVDDIDNGKTEDVIEFLNDAVKECEENEDYKEAGIYARLVCELQDFKAYKFPDDGDGDGDKPLKDRLFERVNEKVKQLYDIEDENENDLGPSR